MIKERQRQVALVTGGGRGIGEHVARTLRNRGVQGKKKFIMQILSCDRFLTEIYIKQILMIL